MEGARFAFERPGDHPTDVVVVAVRAGDAAHPVELLERNHSFVGGDLEDRVGRRVQDQFARVEVTGTEVFDDDGSGGGVVAEELVAGLLLDGADQLVGEPGVGEGSVRLFGDDSGDLPVSGRGVLARAGFGEFAKAHRGMVGGRDAGEVSVQVSEAGRLEVGKVESAYCLCRMSQRVGPFIAVFGGVGSFAGSA